jgi:ribosomal protein L20A (L18A)
MKKKYKVWTTVDQLYIIEAEDKEDASDILYSGEIGNEDIVKEENQEIFSIEEIKK